MEAKKNNVAYEIVNAGEKTQEELGKMIDELKDGEILSIRFQSSSSIPDEEEKGEWEYKC